RAGARFRLVVVDGKDAGKALELRGGNHVIGKSADCALPLDDGLISRRHAELWVTPDGVTVKDLASKNGLYLAGARVSEAQLFAGALLRVGHTTLRFECLDAPVDEDGPTQFGRLIGGAPVMRRLFALLEQIARVHSDVLVDGETGTGKELCAEGLHAHSPRASGPFVVCDLAGIARPLLESELFGHVRGAFTGAERDRVGLIEQADGGTLFLDEVGELDLALQTRLLRVLDQKQVKPIGGRHYRRVDVRVISATRRDLEHEVRDGRFRSDLFFRLAVVRVHLPPLRERSEDLALLTRTFMGERELALPPETLAWLAEHSWPGNVRELRNTIERALLQLEPEAIELPPSLLGLSPVVTRDAPADKAGFTQSRERLLSMWERHYLEQLLARTERNLSRAARESGLDRAYLYRLLKKYRLKS
ncbi:MAG TPA: sigma 54-interacting transcriptional regulator, partial [Polyangia bacterium]|nr:sigma 54-interacting transcriptional regulator [Polyangia bacterium]